MRTQPVIDQLPLDNIVNFRGRKALSIISLILKVKKLMRTQPVILWVLNMTQ